MRGSGEREDARATRELARSLLAEAVGGEVAAGLGLPAIHPPALPSEDYHRQSWNKEHILQAVMDFVAREGRYPLWSEWQDRPAQYGLPVRDTMRRYWGTTTRLYAATEQRTGHRLRPLGRSVSEGESHSLTLDARVAPLAPAVSQMPDNRQGRHGRSSFWDKETILQAVLAFVEREGRYPCSTEWTRRPSAHQLPAHDTMERHWGSKPRLYAEVKRRTKGGRSGTPP
mgnify:CR=1 FL=1